MAPSCTDYGIPPRPPTASTALWTHIMLPGAQNSVSQPNISNLAPPTKPLDKNAASLRILLHDVQAHFEKFTVHAGQLLDGVKETRHEIKSVQSLFERDRESLVGDVTDLVNRAQTEIQKAVGSPSQTAALEDNFKDMHQRLAGLEQRLDSLQAFNQSHAQALQTQIQAAQMLLDKHGAVMATLAPLLPLLQAVPLHIDSLKAYIHENLATRTSPIASGRGRVHTPLLLTHEHEGRLGTKRKRHPSKDHSTPTGTVDGVRQLKRQRTGLFSSSSPVPQQRLSQSRVVSPQAPHGSISSSSLPLHANTSKRKSLTPGQQQLQHQQHQATPRRSLVDLLLPLPVVQDAAAAAATSRSPVQSSAQNQTPPIAAAAYENGPTPHACPPRISRMRSSYSFANSHAGVDGATRSPPIARPSLVLERTPSLMAIPAQVEAQARAPSPPAAQRRMCHRPNVVPVVGVLSGPGVGLIVQGSQLEQGNMAEKGNAVPEHRTIVDPDGRSIAPEEGMTTENNNVLENRNAGRNKVDVSNASRLRSPFFRRPRQATQTNPVERENSLAEKSIAAPVNQGTDRGHGLLQNNTAGDDDIRVARGGIARPPFFPLLATRHVQAGERTGVHDQKGTTAEKNIAAVETAREHLDKVPQASRAREAFSPVSRNNEGAEAVIVGSVQGPRLDQGTSIVLSSVQPPEDVEKNKILQSRATRTPFFPYLPTRKPEQQRKSSSVPSSSLSKTQVPAAAAAPSMMKPAPHRPTTRSTANAAANQAQSSVQPNSTAPPSEEARLDKTVAPQAPVQREAKAGRRFIPLGDSEDEESSDSPFEDLCMTQR